MALEALVGGGLGAIARLAPEVLKFFDRKNERKHELALGDQQKDLLVATATTKLQQTNAEVSGAQFTEAVAALKSAYDTQKSGVPWADGLTATVRPVLTYAFGVSFLFFKMSTGTWDATDTAIFSGILNFWFMGRVFDKASK